MATKTIANGGGAWTTNGTWVEGTKPSAADNVVATGTSGNVNCDFGSVCRSANFTGYVGALSIDAFTLFTIGDGSGGSFTLVSGMTFTTGSGAAITFASTTTGNTITTAGKSLSKVTFNGSGGVWTLQDAMTIATVIGGTGLSVTAGTLNLNGNAVVASDLTGIGVLNMGASTVTLNGDNFNSTVWGFTGTLSSGTSTILVTNGNQDLTFSGNGDSFHIVQVQVGSNVLTFDGNNSFSALQRSGTGTKTIKFTDGTTTTLTGGASAFFSGTAGNLITITGTSTAGWTISTAVNLSCDYLSLDYCTVTGGGKLYAGTHSTNGGHNGANVIFTGPPPVRPGFTQGSKAF